VTDTSTSSPLARAPRDADAVTSGAPTVLVVLVAHDGVAWLPRTLDALTSQTHPSIEVIAVDNASEDGSRELLLDRLGDDRVLVADRDIGFGAAVSMALDARDASDAPYVFTLHDDCALHPEALERLVAAMEADPRLAVVGPKLRSWDVPGQLQSVGCTIDATGRADSGVDADELDQGQRDQGGQALYVPTTAMLVRRDAFESVGRFDRRFHVFRDDLDLCWRLWLSGHEVEIVPGAVGDHAAGAANYLRLGQTRFIGPRYFAERNTLAALLKNYGPLRLLVVIPLYVLVGLAKIVGFVLTRRFSDAWQTLRAWAWNVVHLRETRRYRRVVQDARTRTDGELAWLFGRVGPRVRAYAEAMASWVAGGDVAPAPEPRPDNVPPPPPTSATRRAIALVRRRPVLLTATALSVLFLAAIWPLLLPGEIRGGDLAAWPALPGAFLGDYVAGWHEGGAFGTSATPSPAQALLGLLHLLVGGNVYLAPRVLLLVPFAAAWLLALRAGQTYSRRRLPRVIAATAYVLSPPALAALTTGRVGALVALAVLPGIVSAGITLSRRATPPARAWRAVAGVALLGAIGGAFEPSLLVVLVGVGAAITAVRLVTAGDHLWRTALLGRAGVAVAGPVVLLLPWSLDVLSEGGPLTGSATTATGDELWRWLLLAPQLAGFPGLLAGTGFLLAGLLGLMLAVRRAPLLVFSLWTVALAGAGAGWWLDRTLAVTWAGLPLLATAAAFAGLFAVAFATGEAQLASHAFGWRQLAAVTTAAMVTISLGAVAVSLVTNPWDDFRIDDPALPSFVVAADEESGPFRALVLADRDGVVAWEVVDGAGPTMTGYGVPVPSVATALVDAAVGDLLSGRDPNAADRLGLLGVRYLIVPEGGTSEPLDDALRGQTGIEPRPVPTGRVLAVNGWLPPVVSVSPGGAERIAERGSVPSGVAINRLERNDENAYVGELREPSSVLLAEVTDPGWQARVGSTILGPTGEDLVRFDDVPDGTVTVTHTGTTARGLEVTGQLFAVLLAISLALRPPSFARSFGRDPETVQSGPTFNVPQDPRDPEDPRGPTAARNVEVQA
jgi:GT2 family glycosyltransferase